MPEQNDAFSRYAKIYAISNPDAAKKIQGMFIRFVDKNYHSLPFSKDNMINLAECLEKKIDRLLKGIPDFGEVKNVEVLLVRTRSEEMIDYIREDDDDPVILEVSISQERFVNMLLGNDTKEMVEDGWRHEYSPFIMQLILAISKNHEYSGKYLEDPDPLLNEDIQTKAKNIEKKEIKKRAKNFVIDDLTKLFYNMNDIVELFNSDPRGIYIRSKVLQNNDERMTIFIEEVKHRLNTLGKFLDE